MILGSFKLELRLPWTLMGINYSHLNCRPILIDDLSSHTDGHSRFTISISFIISRASFHGVVPSLLLHIVLMLFGLTFLPIDASHLHSCYHMNHISIVFAPVLLLKAQIRVTDGQSALLCDWFLLLLAW